jgi:DNA polymerase-3 subunit gamma/tau
MVPGPMSYTVLARKYRPQTFADLVGQEHVARTIANAIDTGRVAHAFLFTGVRGVGKTTTARVLAKALNCEKGPTPSPCNVCDACREIAAGHDMDVQEMDGASNNSVEDVRRLQESIPYRPARDRHKIVIVDEVHMLSQGAFNAFLKTLEEPPPHVKFIFATTESHKVPITIRSRCQRYDFRLIPQYVIAERVRHILEAEGIEADDAAVTIVAREAAGSMRDALTLLDQIVAFGGKQLLGKEVERTLGIAGRESVMDAARALVEHDGAATLRAVEALATQGLDMLHFARQLLEYVRELVVLAVTDGEPGTISELVEEERARANELARSAEVLELQRVFSGLAELVEDVGRSSAPRTVLEMGLVRLATRPPLRQVGELLARLDALEKRLGGEGGAAPSRGASEPRRGPRGQAAPPARRAETPSRSQLASVIVSATEAAAAARETGGGATSEPASGPGPASASVSEPASVSASVSEPASGPSRGGLVDEAPAGDVRPVWERIVGRVRDARPALAAILEHGVPLEVARERIVVAFPEGSFFGKQAESADSCEGLADAAANVIGGRPEIVVRFTADAGTNAPTMAQAEKKRSEDAREAARREALSHPRVQEALQVFPEGAGNVQVRTAKEERE